MSTDTSTAEKTVIKAVEQLAAKAGGEVRYQAAESYASAARQLAEAYAWMFSPHQPHGANASTES